MLFQRADSLQCKCVSCRVSAVIHRKDVRKKRDLKLIMSWWEPVSCFQKMSQTTRKIKMDWRRSPRRGSGDTHSPDLGAVIISRQGALDRPRPHAGQSEKIICYLPSNDWKTEWKTRRWWQIDPLMHKIMPHNMNTLSAHAVKLLAYSYSKPSCCKK